jgi:N-acyl homoserine lactone hydrolase
MTATFPERLFMMRVATIRSDDQVVPVPCYLVQMSDGTNILIDSGFPDGAESWPEMEITIDRDVFAYLADLDPGPDEIDLVICTHLDVDHAGQHAAFTNAELIVQREHQQFVQTGDERFELAKALSNDPHLRFRLVDGDTDLLPGIELIESSGHVPGHQAVLIRLPKFGPVLLGVDALPFDMTPFTHENRPIIPFDMDEATTRASTRKLLDIACREGVTLIVYGHDEAQWQQLRLAPEWYG